MKTNIILFFLFLFFFESYSQNIYELQKNIIDEQQEKIIDSLNFKKIIIEKYQKKLQSKKLNRKPTSRDIISYNDKNLISKIEDQFLKKSDITIFNYDDEARIIKKSFTTKKGNFKLTKPSGLWGRTVNDADSTLFIYKKNNLILEKTYKNGLSGIKEFEYSKNKKTIKILNSDGELKSKIIVENDLNSETKTEIDSLGTMISVETRKFIDDKLVVLYRNHKKYGKLKSIIERNDKNQITSFVVTNLSIKKNDKGYSVTNLYKYNSNDLLLSETTKTKLANHTKKYHYNSNNLIKKIEYFVDKKLNGLTVYKYK